MKYKLFLGMLLLAGCLLTPICSALAAPGSIAETVKTLTVFAPPVLEDVLFELKNEYQQKHPDVTINYTLKPPGVLQSQLENGSAADIFISAAAKQINALEQKGMIIAASRKNIASNKLVLIVRNDSDLGITGFQDIASPSVTAFGLANPEAAPVGQYGIDVFKSLGVWDKIRNKAVMTNDGCSIVALVENGTVDAGVVFTTNAATSQKVSIAAYAPAGSHTPIVFPGAVLTISKQSSLAVDFMHFLIDKDHSSIYRKYGFMQMDN